jgi:transposase
MSTSSTTSVSAGKRKRRHFDEQFKRDAVALIDGGRPATQLSRELGVSFWNLRDWKRRYGAGAAAAGMPARSAEQPREGGDRAVAMAAQIGDLQRELAAVTRQRDILKKALAIVGQEEISATSCSTLSERRTLS